MIWWTKRTRWRTRLTSLPQSLWHAFLHLLRTSANDEEARLHLLQLAMLAGSSMDEAVDIAIEFISEDFLRERLQELEQGMPMAQF
jgi:Trp operon repressor